MLNLRRQRGFNIIEIAVTLLVLGLLMAAGLPSMGEWIRNVRVRNLAETTLNGMQKARNEAMKRNKVVTFWLVSPATTASPGGDCKLSAASGAWVISLDNPADACDLPASDADAPRIIETYGPGDAGGSVTVAATNRDGEEASSISFNAFGQPVPGSLPISRIEIEHASAAARKLSIEVSASGGIRMCDRGVEKPDPRACHAPAP